MQVADPNSSGTAYNLLATIVQIMGEEKGFAYLKALHKNVNQYTKSGAAPAQAVNLGETTVGITFMHDMIAAAQDNPDIKTVAPCEGTGYEIGSMSLIKGAHNLDNAKKFYDWALTPGGSGARRAEQILSDAVQQEDAACRSSASISRRRSSSDTISRNTARAVRNALLKRWTDEVKNQPR